VSILNMAGEVPSPPTTLGTRDVADHPSTDRPVDDLLPITPAHAADVARIKVFMRPGVCL
jgi:hypothetical protein